MVTKAKTVLATETNADGGARAVGTERTSKQKKGASDSAAKNLAVRGKRQLIPMTTRSVRSSSPSPRCACVIVKMVIYETDAPELFRRVSATRVRARAGLVRSLAEKYLTEKSNTLDAFAVLRQLGYPPAAVGMQRDDVPSVAGASAPEEIILKNPPQHQLSPNDAAIKSMDDVELF